MDQQINALLLDLILELKREQTEIKQLTIENNVQQKHNTEVLVEHTRRSKAAEDRLDRLEKRDWMVNGFFKISGSLLALAGTIIGVVAAIRHL